MISEIQALNIPARLRRSRRAAAHTAMRPLFRIATRIEAKRLGTGKPGSQLLPAKHLSVRVALDKVGHYYADVPSNIIGGYQMVAGPWDKLVYPLNSDSTWREACRHTRTVYQIFEQDLPIEQTDEYRKLYRKMVRGKSVRKGIKREQEIRDYFQRMFDAFESMKASGFLGQQELGGKSKDDIRVAIDRHGQLVRLGNGRHRFAMAQILAVPSIVVHVSHMHSLWVESCMRTYQEPEPHKAILLGLEGL
ncbi:hypothetical protein LRD18_12300 [Halorhodospira halochloris]|uniref:hypothetical protein n=1 Tax=Halorhodospira halochloris TaxID=1052 RepID=UPI001EE7EAC1|nr:hypothetical protein [Halorhodospira halochloris]MCG5531620.1 hypothetical protein [Halorhodospira halochloris]